jgi:hypothetical protein
MACSHLSVLENELINAGAVETFRGQAWSSNCREWVYFDVVLDIASLSERMLFSPAIKVHENTDPKSGLERGFVCEECHDAIMGRTDGAEIFG